MSDRESRIVAEAVKFFKSRRLAMGMSHDVLAVKAGVSRPAISHIEGGKRRPSLLMALKIARALDIDLGKILHDAGEKGGC